MPFAGGAKGFDDSDSKPKQHRPKVQPGYNTYTRKKRHKRGKAANMHPHGVNRIKGS